MNQETVDRLDLAVFVFNMILLPVLLVVGAIVIIAGCPSPSSLPPEPPVTITEAGFREASSDACATACYAMASAGCPEGNSPNCATVCKTTQGLPNFATSLNVACLARIASPSAEAVRACGVKCDRGDARP